MYTYIGLGGNGRMGNQMFQYATLFSLAKTHNERFAIPSTVERHDFPLNGKYEIIKAFPSLSAEILPKEQLPGLVNKQYREPGFMYDPNLTLTRAETDLHGYFQSELYFKKYRKELLQEFSFSDDVQTRCREMVEEARSLSTNGLVCSLHVRRTDYKNISEYHTNLDASYYNPTIQHMITSYPGLRFLVFSDDIEWCKSNMPEGFSFSTGSSQVDDICTMTMCDLHITANSSFSWWGSWLSESKCTIAPAQWFGPKGPQQWSTIYCEGWYAA